MLRKASKKLLAESTSRTLQVLRKTQKIPDIRQLENNNSGYNPRYIFVLGNDQDAQLSSQALAVRMPGSSIHYSESGVKAKFQAKHLHHAESLLVLGHASVTRIGGLTAAQFAERLFHAFPEKERENLKNLYLIGCEVGMITDSDLSLAQSIADKLYQKGFTNIQIHAIANPENAAGKAMYVEVITNSLLNADGCLNAYLLDNERANELSRLIKDKAKNYKRINEIKNEAFYFLNKADPVKELRKPHNTFKPKENPDQRNKRIANDEWTKFSKEKKQAIELIELRIYHLGYKNRNKKEMLNKKFTRFLLGENLPEQLRSLIGFLMRADEEKWHLVIKDNLKHFKRKVKNGNTYKLLAALAEKDFHRAENIIDKRHKEENKIGSAAKTKVEKKRKIKHKKRPEQPAPLSEADSKSTTQSVSRPENLAARSRTYSESSEEQRYTGAASDSSDEQAVENSPLLPGTDRLSSAKSTIHALIRQLTFERRELQMSCFCFSPFNLFEIASKTEKINALRNVHNQADIHALQKAANEALQHWRVRWSLKRNFTNELLNKIGKGEALPDVQKYRCRVD